jgi:hypothetical protein
VPTILVDITNQTAGAEEQIDVPNGHIFTGYFLAIRLVTDATVGNRQLTVDVRDAGDNVVYTAGAAATQAASLDVTYYAHPAGDPVLPDIWVPAGGDIRIYDSAAISASDNITLRGWATAST